LSGPLGATPSWTNTPFGGRGASSSYGIGASFKPISRGEPVTVDLGGCANGYLCDETRTFCIGSISDRLNRGLEELLELQGELEKKLVPGAVCGEIYDWAVAKMNDLGYGDAFMGPAPDQVRFIGHGVGVELDEYPFLSKNNKMELKAGMVLAMEPKLAFRDEGIVGVEDTFLITENGAKRLTENPQGLVICHG